MGLEPDAMEQIRRVEAVRQGIESIGVVPLPAGGPSRGPGDSVPGPDHGPTDHEWLMNPGPFHADLEAGDPDGDGLYADEWQHLKFWICSCGATANMHQTKVHAAGYWE